MVISRSIALFALLPLVLLSGCGGNVAGYPSLAPRPIEKAAQMPLPPLASVAQPAPAIVTPQIAAIIGSAHQADAAFQAKLAELRPTIEKGVKEPPGSENWVVAQEAYTTVDTLRGGVGTALADLDPLHQQAVAAADAPRQAAIEAAIAELQAIDQAERATLATLQPAG